MSQTSKLELLQKKHQALQDQIRREKLRLAKDERKKDTRRKILVGATILNEAENDSDLASRLHKLLNSQLTRADDRALFDLALLAEEPDQKEANAG